MIIKTQFKQVFQDSFTVTTVFVMKAHPFL